MLPIRTKILKVILDILLYIYCIDKVLSNLLKNSIIINTYSPLFGILKKKNTFSFFFMQNWVTIES